MYSKFIKRIFDILFCLIALPFLIIFTIIIGIAIKIEDRGPIIYKSKRIGKDSKIFDMYKFRSMKVGAPNILNKDGSTYNSSQDSRVTKVGKVIRKTSIDELPQIINVLIGNMSFIGPRAGDVEGLGTYKKDELDKMKVKPGITGYCQAYYRNSIGVREKRLKDAWYANNVSFWLDLTIFFKTIITVLKRENIYTNTTKGKKGYLFLSNGNKEPIELYESKENIKINSMRKACLDAISEFDYNIYMGINKKYASEIKADFKKHIKMYDANIYRSIFNIKDIYIAYKNLNKFLKENRVDVIHCNTPIGGFLGRICGHKNNVKKIIYTAHGFHFYKSNNIIKNYIFRTIEKRLALRTDAIITMNEEDYEAAKKFRLKDKGKVYYTHGVGIELDKFRKCCLDINKKRKELGLNSNDIIIISMGDLIKRKNYKLALDIIANCKNKRIKYLICGSGPEKEPLKKYVEKLGISNQVIFMGYRNDIIELLKISDIFLLTSVQEGLPRSTMEAMAAGLPCVVSKIRGNTDLIDNNNGYLCKSLGDYVSCIDALIEGNQLRKDISNNNLEKIKKYSYDNIKNEIKKIYMDMELDKERTI